MLTTRASKGYYDALLSWRIDRCAIAHMTTLTSSGKSQDILIVGQKVSKHLLMTRFSRIDFFKGKAS